MKKTITVNCPAKINLSLDVLGKRDDGYHNLSMIMQELSLADVIHVSMSGNENKIDVSCSNPHVPLGSDNIASRAAEMFLSEINKSCHVEIHIEKNIPMGAGLGGGSSDAAGVLKALNSLSGSPLSTESLCEIGAKLGADVPFFLYGGSMLAEGIGTVLSEAPALKGAFVLLAKPPFGVSTPFVYKNLRLTEETNHPDTNAVLSALDSGDLGALAKSAGNVLESVTASIHPEIEDYKKIMMENGAVYSLMSGSGPTVFGVFEDRQKAESSAEILKNKTNEVFVTLPVE